MAITSCAGSHAGEAWIFGSSRARKESNWRTGSLCPPGHGSWPSSQSLGTTRVKLERLPAAIAASNTDVSLGAVVPIGRGGAKDLGRGRGAAAEGRPAVAVKES